MSTVEQLQTPLHDWHAAHEGRMVDFAGWAMPVQYRSIVEEHAATRNAVGLFDVSHMGRLQFRGEDATALLDRVLTRRVDNLAVGAIRYSLVCNQQGGILDDVLVYRLDCSDAKSPTHQLVVNASNRAKILDWLNQHKSTLDVEITDATRNTAMIAVQGPQSIALAEPLIDVPLASMKYYRGASVKFAGRECFVSRTGYTGEDGCELTVGAEDAAAVWQQLIEKAALVGGGAVGLGARDTLRLEAAMPLYGHELNEKTDPLQAGLGFACDFEGRDFLGRDALLRKHAAGQQQWRIGLSLSGRRAAREGHAVYRIGSSTSEAASELGLVTSGTFSPTLGEAIAMAYVNQPLSPDTPVEVDIRGKRTAARVRELPFYRRVK